MECITNLVFLSYCTSSVHGKGLRYFSLGVFATAISNDRPFSIPIPRSFLLELGRSTSFFSGNFNGGCSLDYFAHSCSTIRWQIRYFRPLYRSNNVGCTANCLLFDRQNVTVRQGSEQIWLQEERARVSFGVLNRCPGLFHILILGDDDLRPRGRRKDWHDKDHTKENWRRYGFEAQEKVIPVTHFLLEICRIFEKSMGAWGETLDSIDKLIHVNVSRPITS